MSRRTTGPEIERLIQLLAKLPGLGPRSARRAALFLIKNRERLLAPLASAMAILVVHDQAIIIRDRHHMHPIGIFKHVIGIKHRTFRRDAAIRAQPDPSVRMDQAAAGHAPGTWPAHDYSAAICWA